MNSRGKAQKWSLLVLAVCTPTSPAPEASFVFSSIQSVEVTSKGAPLARCDGILFNINNKILLLVFISPLSLSIAATEESRVLPSHGTSLLALKGKVARVIFTFKRKIF